MLLYSIWIFGLFSSSILCSLASETVEQAAYLARALVTSQSIGTLATVYPADSDLSGQAFALMEYYSACSSNGSLHFISFSISRNVKNILASPSHAATFTIQAPLSDSPVQKPRLAIMGNVSVLKNDAEGIKEVEACYVANHPDTTWWLPGKSGFHDASWARFDPASVYYVGGFGGAHYIGYIPLDLYRSATPKEKQAEEGTGERSLRFRIQQ